MLELNKLTGQLDVMADALARQRSRKRDRILRAREQLLVVAQVTEELREKLAIARQVDESWRGADPLGERLDERCQTPQPPRGRSARSPSRRRARNNHGDLAIAVTVHCGGRPRTCRLHHPGCGQ